MTKCHACGHWIHEGWTHIPTRIGGQCLQRWRGSTAPTGEANDMTTPSEAPDPASAKSMSIDSLVQRVNFGRETVFDAVNALYERADGSKVTAPTLVVSARKLNPEAPRPPVLAESPPRRHVFHSAQSLGDYLARYGRRETVVFADQQAEEFSAVLHEREHTSDEKNIRQGGFEIVSMKPQEHPLWTPWRAIAGREIDVKEFAQFLTQHRRSVTEPNGKALSILLSQVRTSVSIEVQTGRGRSAVNGIMVTTKVTGANDQKDALEIPDTIKIRVPLYAECEPEEIELDLTVQGSEEGATVIVSAGTVLEARIKAFEKMLRVVTEKTADLGLVVTHGKPQHGQWSALQEKV